MSEISSRTMRRVRSGKVIDECNPEDVPDVELHRSLPEPMDIKVEVQVRDAPRMFQRQGPDVADIFSPPRVVHDAGMRKFLGTRLKPGWSVGFNYRGSCHWTALGFEQGRHARPSTRAGG